MTAFTERFVLQSNPGKSLALVSFDGDELNSRTHHE